MKGNEIAYDLMEEQEQDSYLKKNYVNVYGLGDVAFCESNVRIQSISKRHQTFKFMMIYPI